MNLIIILIAALVWRLLLSPFGTLLLDHNTFVAWSQIVAKGGFASFYSGWSDYLPGYVYVLWLLGHIHTAIPALSTHILYKIPAILADVTTGYLIYKIVFNLNNKKFALIAAGIYLFNPAIIANSTLWGQVDSFTALFSLAAVYFASVSPIASAVCLAVGTVIKPQAALIALPILFIAYRKKWSIQTLLIYGAVGALVFASAFLPFANGANIISFIQTRLTTTMTQYPYTSVNAFNLWALGGMWKPDTWQNVAGISATLLVSIVAAFKLRKVKHAEYILAAVVLWTGFMFMTRLHERHALPVLAPLAVVVGMYPNVLFSYVLLSFVYVANLYYAFIWITQDFKNVFSNLQINLLILINALGYGFLIGVVRRGRDIVLPKFKELRNKNIRKEFALSDNFPKKIVKKALIGILVFALASRLLGLNAPKEEYFDEVYHAFTARTLLHNDPKAWEWWNPNPEGFAYEWTHPPLAKEIMVIGMKILGENPLGWRVPAVVFGLGCIYLIYAITKKLFNSDEAALVAAAFFALDGLTLVMSRIGMNDIYMLFFVLLSLYLYMRDKYLFSSIALGLAASSKWSTMWFLPILVVSHFLLKKKFSVKYLWYAIIPPLVYLATYIPFFTSGHTVDQFIELQKQMWWYHTGLKATHGFSSPWWSWPLGLRPVWLYVNRDLPNMVANIYAQGNPLINWMGVGAAVTAIYWAIRERSKKLGLIIFAFLIFFVSWAASPRIMFYYHFLPSTAFLTIILGYVATRLKLTKYMLLVALIVFIYFYPHWTGIQIPQSLDNSYYWLESWR